MKLPSKISSACFTGHRELSDIELKTIQAKLNRLLLHLIKHYGLQSFYAGGAIGLDTLASLVVLDVKKQYPDIRLNLVLPCNGQESKWTQEQKAIYSEIKERADSIRILSPFFYNGCMQVRNREMLLCSDLCIAYLRAGTSSGGSLNTVIQATKMGIPVINLADPESEYLNEISK